MAKQCVVEEFEALYRDYRDMVFKTAYLALGDAGEAEDVLQEVFVKIHKSWSTYDSEKGSLYAWIHRITINQCISQRRRRHVPFVSLDLLQEQGFDPTDAHNDSPEELLMKQENGEKVRRAMDRLDWKHRVVVVLKYHNGLSYDEIAQILGIPLGTVRSRLNTAMKVLRRELAEGGAIS